MGSSFNVDGLGETETWMKIYKVTWTENGKEHSKLYKDDCYANKFIHDQTKVLGKDIEYKLSETLLYFTRTGARSKK